jgi:cobalamin biosynthesis Mg chelatase CobN
MDPLTILAAAQAAYGALQAGIAAGKEIQSMAADLSELWGSVAKLTHISAETPRISVFSKKSAEQIAMERYAAKAEAQDLALRAKNMFVGKFGLAAWDQVQKEVINIRKEIEKQQWEEDKAQAARMEEIKEAGVVFMIVMGTLAVMLLVGAIFLERIN